MLRETHGHYSSSVVVACNGCGAECDESRQHAVDPGAAIGWNGLLAIASAKSAGWSQPIEKRIRRDYCPSCAARGVNHAS